MANVSRWFAARDAKERAKGALFFFFWGFIVRLGRCSVLSVYLGLALAPLEANSCASRR